MAPKRKGGKKASRTVRLKDIGTGEGTDPPPPPPPAATGTTAEEMPPWAAALVRSMERSTLVVNETACRVAQLERGATGPPVAPVVPVVAEEVHDPKAWTRTIRGEILEAATPKVCRHFYSKRGRGLERKYRDVVHCHGLHISVEATRTPNLEESYRFRKLVEQDHLEHGPKEGSKVSVDKGKKVQDQHFQKKQKIGISSSSAITTQGGRRQTFDGFCYNCGEYGHNATYCNHPRAQPEGHVQKSFDGYCYNCGEQGQIANNCKQPRVQSKGQQGQRPQWQGQCKQRGRGIMGRDSMDKEVVRPDKLQIRHRDSYMSCHLEHHNLYQQCHRILLLGDKGVNKRSILQRFSDDDQVRYSDEGDSYVRNSIHADGKSIAFEVRTLSLLGDSRNSFYANALAIWLVYDITNKSSFNNIKNWFQDIESYARDDVYMMLVENKPDSFHRFFKRRVVPTSEGQALADVYDMKFCETGGAKYFKVDYVLSMMMTDINQRLLKAEKEIQFSPAPNQFLYDVNRASSAPHTHDGYYVQLLLLGDKGVGKNSLRTCARSKSQSVKWRRGISRFSLPIDEKLNKYEIISSSERLRDREYFKRFMGVMLVYDVTNESTFKHVRAWIRNVEMFARDNVCMILVGNKVDVDETQRVVPTPTGQALADEYGIQFFKTSAVTEYNVEQAILSLARDPIEVLEYGHLLYNNAFGNKKSLR
ncbi:hypothetical protein IFM89_006260 [Coptis chinensis]|uniref:CCHC-type domain-containing protein n=1 Tax=Coptis chinensis TaxID=261450 RepID=A0A835LB58_9MAGN|nr:hypothetical protein IFM89_006260 [Coptis chinensis]